MNADFSLELPQLKISPFGQTLLSLTQENPFNIKVMRYALWTLTFAAAGFAFSAPSFTTVRRCTLLTAALLPAAIVAERLFQEILGRAFNEAVGNIADAIPTINPEGLERIRLSHLKEKWAKGMHEGAPFFAFKREKEGVEYVDCYVRDGREWIAFNKVHSKAKGKKSWQEWEQWQRAPSVFPDRSTVPADKLLQLFYP